MGILYVVATPIGNLEDITLRAIRILLTVPVIACEDTRRTGQLVKLLGTRWADRIGLNPIRQRRYISVRDFNEVRILDKVLAELTLNDVALVSDAGTPLISDPGFKVVRAARQAGFTVSPVPGPSAAIAALSVSGLPTDKFVFWGFLPKRWELMPDMTNVIYESPHRLKKTLQEIEKRYPQAEVVVASELTKVHEQVKRVGPYSMSVKGEHVIVVNFSRS